MIGSFLYMAPERFRAREADARADIYALAGVI
jgi:serine/threonine protein kinase